MAATDSDYRILQTPIAEFNERIGGRGSNGAHSPDVRQRTRFRDGEVYPAANSIKLSVLYTALARTGAGDTAHRVPFVFSVAQTARPAEITILPRRSSDA